MAKSGSPTGSTLATIPAPHIPGAEADAALLHLPVEPLCLLVSGRSGVTVVRLENGRDYVIGRGARVDVFVEDRMVSREHVRVATADGRLVLTDLGGVNGTLVNGRKLESGESVRLKLGTVFELGDTTLVVQRAAALIGADGERIALRPPRAENPAAPPNPRVVHDEGMLRQYALLDTIAHSSLSVLILGETGVGKEVFAAAVHESSSRSHKPFLQLNCAALPESLFEAELFGYERGAFTGAVGAKPGMLESADGGTVFLDEVGDIPLNIQVKLLRVLDTGRAQRLGANREFRADVRFVAATNRDLRAAIMDGEFRQDLYFRLNGITFNIPPLRRRRAEIVPLAEHFGSAAAAKSGRGRVTIGSAAIEALERYSWPGNVRELRNVIDRAAAVCKGNMVTVDDLSLDPLPIASSLPPAPPQKERRKVDSGDEDSNLRKQMDALEKRLIEEALEKFGGNRTRAARALGISRRILLLRLDEYAMSGGAKKKGKGE